MLQFLHDNTVIDLIQMEKINQGKIMLPLAVFFYGGHNQAIENHILSVQPRFTIFNTLHGPWGQISGNSVMRDRSIYKSAGIKVIGYLTSGYEAKGSAGRIDPQCYSLETNLEFIKNMALIDNLDGVFIDECSAFPTPAAQTYLKTLTDTAHSYGLITWGNVGLAQFDSWFFTRGGFDLMNSDENWHGQELSPVQRDWGYRISVTGSNPRYNAQDAFDITINAWEKGLAYCYFNDGGYNHLSPWIEEYTGLLKKYETSLNSSPMQAIN